MSRFGASHGFQPRHYHCRWPENEPRGIFQIDNELDPTVIRCRRKRPTLPESILRLAHAEYERQHSGQDYERIQQRGGFSILEVVRLLADHVERLGGTTAPRNTAASAVGSEGVTLMMSLDDYCLAGAAFGFFREHAGAKALEAYPGFAAVCWPQSALALPPALLRELPTSSFALEYGPLGELLYRLGVGLDWLGVLRLEEHGIDYQITWAAYAHGKSRTVNLRFTDEALANVEALAAEWIPRWRLIGGPA